MRDFFLAQLKAVYESHSFTEEEQQILAGEVSRMTLLGKMMRQEGLLVLIGLVDDDPYVISDGSNMFERYPVSPLEKDGFDPFLRDLLALITEGTDNEYVWDFGEATMCTSALSPVELIRYMICLEGASHIQCGSHPHLLEMILTAYLPLPARRKAAEDDSEYSI